MKIIAKRTFTLGGSFFGAPHTLTIISIFGYPVIRWRRVIPKGPK